ncbi:DUF1127 domain-containing protein [Aureimonas leprariae]|uniref:DUF1127 domain-containing protein n=1 Tax=Plantimonas leprariae TaxID=2615207 RepID=A0A7V7TVL4_9HYPH|nr:DUF1127 domain-containing protein [Aureimonas leprariae]KAB0678056.1 DUF1127 domain-containing protein [Aureimonas leprariae]
MNITRALRSYRSYRSTVNELDRLSNRELADLGIARSEIPTVARQSIR